jgi:hypothetical protein
MFVDAASETENLLSYFNITKFIFSLQNVLFPISAFAQSSETFKSCFIQGEIIHDD